MYKTILADGTEILSGGGGANGSRLWVFGLNMTLQDAMIIFSDPEKTANITVFYNESLPVDVFEGYTLLTGIMVENGETKVRLERRYS